MGRALGIPDVVLEYGAGWAQGKADGFRPDDRHPAADADITALLNEFKMRTLTGDHKSQCQWGGDECANDVAWRVAA